MAIARYTNFGLAFASAAFVLGFLRLAEVYLLLTAITALALWAWREQAQLRELSLRQRTLKGALAFAVIGITLVAAFELGQMLGGHT